MAIYETHCHLNHPQFADDWETVYERALEVNVRRLLVVSYDQISSRRAVELANKKSQLFASIGIHPEDAQEWSEPTREELINLLASNRHKVIAWGEIGLDYHWETHEPSVQKHVFIEQLETARSLNLPAIIHCRDAYDDTLDILEGFSNIRAVVHCFTGTVDQAKRAVSLGCYIGIGGVITYKNAQNVRDIAQEIPTDRILIETDSPFLAPQKWRGKRNEPAYLVSIIAKLAETLGKTIDEVEEATWRNALALFG